MSKTVALTAEAEHDLLVGDRAAYSGCACNVRREVQETNSRQTNFWGTTG
jgi:hypothetical protein